MTTHSPSNKANESLILLRHPQPKEQCRQDYLMAIAENNYLKGIPDLCKVLEVDFRVVALANARSLARILRLGKHYTPHSVHNYIGSKNRDLRAYGMCKEARICPLCLREGAYVPHIFNSPLTLICPAHQCLLYDECNECGSPITYMRRARNYCGSCYADFRYFPVDEAPDFIHQFFEHFSRPRSELQTATHIMEYKTAIFVDIAETLGAGRVVFRYFPRIKRRNLPIMKELLTDWPKKFFQLVDGSGHPDRSYLFTQCQRTLAGSPAAQAISSQRSLTCY